MVGGACATLMFPLWSSTTLNRLMNCSPSPIGWLLHWRYIGAIRLCVAHNIFCLSLICQILTMTVPHRMCGIRCTNLTPAAQKWILMKKCMWIHHIVWLQFHSVKWIWIQNIDKRWQWTWFTLDIGIWLPLLFPGGRWIGIQNVDKKWRWTNHTLDICILVHNNYTKTVLGHQWIMRFWWRGTSKRYADTWCNRNRIPTSGVRIQQKNTAFGIRIHTKIRDFRYLDTLFTM